MGDYCRRKQLKYHSQGILSRREITPDMFCPQAKKLKIELNDDIIEMKCAFIRVNYSEDPQLPKSKLIAYCGKHKLDLPTYTTINRDKLFRAVATFQGKKYSSTYWYVVKQIGAALVLACSLGLIKKEDLIEDGSMLE
ncbi:tRNA-dihydrouridine(20) synthase [NAD(P)+]-like [Asbolus verrucosus]|uniref:tRNA-dihydrouridine(20) synthase [NAD(P)+]-like n=1 Tax=Asbolus verrucosus TaxID=1661398 RepID=A0A482VED7_ASBVE|nr:tRNA-dihydrouridine(20) synthase [NAD(P)+]-like [Asbolus verrucosus]